VRTCNEIRSLMADWLDDELTPVLKTRVDEHLAGCRECREAYATMEAMEENLSLLGAAANRIADRATPVVRRRSSWQMTWTRAAAIVLIFVGGWFIARTRYSPRDQWTSADRTPAKQRSDAPASTNTSNAALESDCRAIGHTAVAIATANPRVRIVWLYEDAGVGEGSTKSSSGPKPRPQS
jgi:anti-sigma factor RsiW